MSAVRHGDITPEAVVVSIDVAELLRRVSDVQLRAECARRATPVPGDAAALTGAHIRAARGFLDWSLARLHEASGVSISTIKRLEDARPGGKRPGKVDAVRRALESAGVAFRVVDGVLCVARAQVLPALPDDAQVWP